MPAVEMLNFSQDGWFEEQLKIKGPTAQTKITIGPYQARCVLFIHASASSQAQAEAKTTGAGIQLSIFLDHPDRTTPVSFDECYEGQPGGVMTFQSSASYACPVEKNKKVDIYAKVDGYGGAAIHNQHTNLRLQCVALAATFV